MKYWNALWKSFKQNSCRSGQPTAFVASARPRRVDRELRVPVPVTPARALAPDTTAHNFCDISKPMGNEIRLVEGIGRCCTLSPLQKIPAFSPSTSS